jgi:membrane protein required for colicin V production
VNWVDLVVIAVVVCSGLLAFLRGFVREVLGIGAWLGAAAFTYQFAPDARPTFQQWIGNPDYAGAAAMGVCFLVALIVLSVIASLLGRLVRGSALGGVDRSLGVLFGVARGAALVVFAYVALGLVVAPEQWPEPVLQARTLPYVYQGAVWANDRLGHKFNVPPPPPSRVARAADLLHANPQGRAVGHP